MNRSLNGPGSKIFHRPVTGVHNRTLGILFDLVECLVQRDFGYVRSNNTHESFCRASGNARES